MVEENPTDVGEYQAKRPLGVIQLVIWAAINSGGVASVANIFIGYVYAVVD